MIIARSEGLSTAGVALVRKNADGGPAEPSEPELNSIRFDADKVKTIRSRLSDISWWMRLLCQRIAQKANKEDETQEWSPLLPRVQGRRGDHSSDSAQESLEIWAHKGAVDTQRLRLRLETLVGGVEGTAGSDELNEALLEPT